MTEPTKVIFYIQKKQVKLEICKKKLWQLKFKSGL